MKIASLSLEPLRIPFRVSFKHASAERNVTQSEDIVAGLDQISAFKFERPRHRACRNEHGVRFYLFAI
ncbi:MAG: hypothetical protein H0T87_12750 [Gammaproteobacteria bacterium]|nr:hypothetical protein [Gammaproteobacteria bacterium]